MFLGLDHSDKKMGPMHGSYHELLDKFGISEDDPRRKEADRYDDIHSPEERTAREHWFHDLMSKRE
jgi:hypothetical protein